VTIRVSSLTLTSPVDPETRSCDLLVRNGYVLSMDATRTVYPSGAVAIEGDRIVAVGPEQSLLPRFRPARVLDARGAIVHPGFVEAHTHVTLHTTRGAFPDGADAETSFSYYTRWFNCLEQEDEHASTLLACVEMLHGGITCFMDAGTVFEPDAAGSAAEAVGIRGSLGEPFLWDVPEYPMAAGIGRIAPTTGRALASLGSELWRNREPHGLVRGHVALYGVGSASDELMLAAKQCADENGAIFTQHQSLEQEDTDADDARFGRHPLVHFAELGLLGPNCTFSHMNVLRDDEIRPVVDSGMSLVWNPGNVMSYAITSTSRSRITELLELGVGVALGTDVGKFWAYGEQGWLGFLLAREWGGSFPAEVVLEMATVGGARAIGQSGTLGSLEPGKKADLVIRSTEPPEAQPGVNPIRDLALVVRSKGVDTVVVDGRIVMRHGRLVLIDEGAVYEVARESARRLAERAGIPRQHSWPTVE
jgi:cytosine/adenosine deaminase-related metal-dependent hydrolase